MSEEIGCTFWEKKEGEDGYGKFITYRNSERKVGKDGIEIGNANTYTMTVDLGDNRALKLLVRTDNIPTDTQRKNLKEQMGITIRTREEDEELNGKHKKQ